MQIRCRWRAVFEWRQWSFAFICTWLVSGAPAFADESARTVVHLLDYIAVDYGEAVADGKVKNADEFKEMAEFAAQVNTQLRSMSEVPQRGTLMLSAQRLADAIAAKSEVSAVAAQAISLRNDVIARYRLAIGPRRAPELKRGAQLYAENCGACHGEIGRGDGPSAKGLNPAPSNFHDRERMTQRSVYGLFNTITLGVNGTAMAAYAQLPEQDRWALAFHVANLGAEAAMLQAGEAGWKSGSFGKLDSLSSVAGQSEQEVRATLGAEAVAVLAWLRSRPQSIDRNKASPIEFARQKNTESLALYRAGKAEEANRAALTGYLEGFELVEASLQTVDAELLRKVEALMIAFRNAIQSGRPVREVEALAEQIDQALEKSEQVISTTALSPVAVFLASFVILFREGLEAVLVVTALLVFVKRSGQTAALPYLHGGWLAALLLGGVTWAAANWLIKINGADRELTEGVTALIASAMLLYVGFWLHDKSHAQAWQGFLMRGAKAIKPGAAWGLALMAFLAVYREVFETVLFYQALWVQAGESQAVLIVAGLMVAALALAVITWAMLKYSLRLPLGLFFGASGILLAVLAVILAGNGIAALQEAGALPIAPIGFVTIGWLGIYPNLQSLGLQLLLVTVIVVAFALSARRRPEG